MKKVLLTLCVVLGSMVNLWAMTPAKAKDVETLASEYRNQEGFEVVTLGRLGLSLIKGAAILSGELTEEDRAALEFFNGITRLVIVDFEGAADKPRKEFTRKLEKILSKMVLIMEAKDSGETVRVYGIDEGESIRDCVLYSSEGALVVAKGRISLENLGMLKDMAE